VTTENTEVTSALDSDQAQLDAVQEAPTPQTTTDQPMTEELRALREEFVKSQQMIAGLQSKVDRGLNAIRKDTEEATRAQQQRAVQQYLEQVPEEHRAAFQALANQNLQYQQQLSDQQYQEPAVGQQPEVSGEWEQIYAIPRSMGIDPQAEGIDYAAFTDPGLSEGQRRDRFFQSIKTVMSTGTTPPVDAQRTEQPSQEIQNPPTSGTPAGGVSGSLRTEEQIQRAYIEGKLSKDEYTKRLAEAGLG
tara:strand:+ start:3730 stop:4470 length:741 start_codon:yes stop_codon:yes gene_type:complete